ncbi:enoyl-CoA hydratase/isomerase family protein [Acidovorax facilis]|jgi:enoyl-CoA hydratase/carnithine racemase|uniref:enoyl-CoA hydratase/isomerase family protein n=1 Tax=Acidovorax facilis TaxID=12917 RepID=UPI003D652020
MPSTIARPHRRNACDFAAWSDLKTAFETLGSDPTVKLIVLTGAGGHFCAGDDVVAFSSVAGEAEKDVWRARIQECYAALQSVPKPVIAALSGVCVGGGCSLAMCCDFRVGDSTARVGVPVAKLGLVYPTIQLQRLAWLIGASNARRWVYEATLYDAVESYRVGYLDALVQADVVEAAFAFGADMGKAAPLSIAGSKSQLNAVLAGRVEQERERLDAMVLRADRSEDFREAARAFAEKRQPIFKGH